MPFSVRGLVQHVRAYEELTIQAAISGDEPTALLGLMANPLVPSFDMARALWRDIKAEDAVFLPAFSGDPRAVSMSCQP
jgi:6-phospho-beta-glucosidase